VRGIVRRPLVAMVGSAAALVGSSLVWHASPVQAAFPGGNGVIACASFRDGDSEIFTFSPSGTEQGVKQLTFNTSSESRPRYSPDGRKIAFESNMDGPSEIYIMNADGTGVRRLTFTGVPGVHGNSSPAWSPGGDQIAYQTTRNGNFDVYRIDIDGTNDTPLTNLPVEESLPAWSPLGDKIALNSRAVDPSANVHLMNPDGTGHVSLPAPGNLPGVEDSWPTWSPDGSMIGYHSRRDDPGGEEIYRMNRDGSNVVRLTFNGPNQFDIFPAWSPDGTRIVWNSQRNGATNFGEVFTMNASNGGNVVRITNNVAVDQRCDWQPLCTLYGAGDIYGTAGNDIICGSDGPDRIFGGGGNDIILGLGGDDQLLGNVGGNDRLFGGAGNDRITGQGGADIVDGGIGVDQCIAPTRNCP
jgi:Tol biopolymer transport system component